MLGCILHPTLLFNVDYIYLNRNSKLIFILMFSVLRLDIISWSDILNSMYNIFRLILSLIPFLWSIDISTTFLCSMKRVRICMHSFKMHVILVLHVCYLSIHEKLFCICRTNIQIFSHFNMYHFCVSKTIFIQQLLKNLKKYFSSYSST